MNQRMVSLITGLALATGLAPAPAEEDGWRSMPEVLAASSNADWRDIAPENTLYMELNGGTVVMEVAPGFAPAHVANLRKLIDAGYFSAAAIKRSQDNYVVQWSGAEDAPIGDAADRLEPEFFRPARGLAFAELASDDAYAEAVGFVDGFPVGRDGERAWLAHCYGMLGAGRATEPDSGNAGELYVVTGHAPRHLDRNVTLLGRVISGMEHLSSLPRGSGPLGFYEDESEHAPIRSLRFGTDYDPSWQALRTDTETFEALVQSRQYRNEDWFADPAGKIGLCNVPLPVRRL